MAAEILTTRAHTAARWVRDHTRELRFFCHLIKLRWRLWLVPIWPFKNDLYPQYPSHPWAGEAVRGEAMLRGSFCEELGGESYQGDFWKCVDEQQPASAQRQMYEFAWLRNLAACKPEAKAAEFARNLIQEFQERHAEHSDSARYVTVRAERLAMCLSFHGFLTNGASFAWQQRQYRYYVGEILMLADVLRRKKHYVGFTGIKALLFTSMLFPKMQFLRHPVKRMLNQAMKLRFFKDGGHHTRSPEFQRWDIRTLLEIRAAMKERQIPISPEFDEALQKGLDALATLSHGDGKISCFHSSIEQPVTDLANLWQVWRKSKPLPQKTLPNTGYVHLRRGDSRMILDVGYKFMRSNHHYAGALAFEFSREGARAIVNCGDYRGTSRSWEAVSHHTAAHSTLCLDHYDAWGTGAPEGDFEVGTCAVEEAEDHIKVTANHHGYTPTFHVMHERSISVSDDGNELRGVDTLIPVKPSLEQQIHRHPKSPENAYVRFHLHPSASVEKATPQFVSLRLKNDEIWEFWVEEGQVLPTIEESVYLGDGGLPKSTVQLVIQSPMSEEQKAKKFRWKLILAKNVTSLQD